MANSRDCHCERKKKKTISVTLQLIKNGCTKKYNAFGRDDPTVEIALHNYCLDWVVVCILFPILLIKVSHCLAENTVPLLSVSWSNMRFTQTLSPCLLFALFVLFRFSVHAIPGAVGNQLETVHQDDHDRSLEKKITDLRAALEATNEVLAATTQKLEAQDTALEVANAALTATMKEVTATVKEVKEKNAVLEASNAALQKAVKELMPEKRELEAMDKELKTNDAELETKNEGLEAKVQEPQMAIAALTANQHGTESLRHSHNRKHRYFPEINVFNLQDDNRIFACVGRTGLLRFVGAPNSCRRREVFLEWNKMGPTGPPGPVGPTGPPGPGPGPTPGSCFPAMLNLADLDGSSGFIVNGIDFIDTAGQSVSSAGDVNGDGLADILIGAPGGDPNGNIVAGEAYVIFGSETGFTSPFDLSSLDGTNGFVINGIDTADFAGISVSNAGDVNGDRVDDILIGAPGGDPNGNNQAGEAYVIFGSDAHFTSALDLSNLNGTKGFVINGIDVMDCAGQSVSNAGDVNGDGRDDILIGAPTADPNGNIEAGEAYVIFGSGAVFTEPFDLSSLDGTNGFVIMALMLQPKQAFLSRMLGMLMETEGMIFLLELLLLVVMAITKQERHTSFLGQTLFLPNLSTCPAWMAQMGLS